MTFKEVFTNFRFSVGLKTFITGGIAAVIAYVVADKSLIAPISHLVDIGFTGLFFEVASYAKDIYEKSQAPAA